MPTIGLPAAVTLDHRAVTESTNDDAVKLAREGAPDFTIVWAREQTAGRGRFSRPWLSKPGNLYCSTIIRLAPNGPRSETLSLVAALATAEAIRPLVAPRYAVQVKWVNDVIVDGRKISGNLNESSPDADWVVMGIGVNVALRPEIDNPHYTAICLNDVAERAVSVEETLSRLANVLWERVQAWRAYGLDDAFRDAYGAMLWRMNETVRVSFDANRDEGLSGINRGITKDGHLRLELPSGEERVIYAGDVMGAPA